MKTKVQIQKLPRGPGIYKFYDNASKLLYVGKSISIKKRVASYFTSKNLGPKTNLLVKNIARVEFIKVFSEFEALLLEAELIRTHQPFYNSERKDDKSPIYIKIEKTSVPLISLVRKPLASDKSFIKGPFPSAKTAKDVLRLVRRIFPYCHHKNPAKPCLYVHLGLCPYPYADQKSQIDYVKTIKKIKLLLSGKSKILIKSLTREMNLAAKNLHYEQAQAIKKQIEGLEYLTTTYRQPREFLEQPNLVDDLTLKRLSELKNQLKLERVPRRIECYDISNIQGKMATGSMVVFENGQKNTNEYRRFRIKFSNSPNDYEMLKEVLSRRFKNNWPMPDLIIIDGGRGQLNSALSIISPLRLNLTVVSLAKRLEEIYTPNEVLPLSLPKENPARQLAQAIRDEAHRFAITYHRKLRSKAFLLS